MAITYTWTIESMSVLQTPDPDFLTETLVLEWVTAELGENGVSSAEGCVEGQINSIVTPPVSPTSEPLPW